MASPPPGAPPSLASMLDSIVADAGGLLVLAGLLDGTVHQSAEVLALDATSLLVAEYLALRHEGAPARAQVAFVAVAAVVQEWFPVRSLALDAVLAAASSRESDALAALALAQSLGVPLLTKNVELQSDTVPVLVC